MKKSKFTLKKITLIIFAIVLVAIVIRDRNLPAPNGERFAAVFPESYRERSYAAYLKANGWDGQLASSVIVIAGTADAAIYADANAGDDADLSWDFEVVEAGFYIRLVRQPIICSVFQN